MLITKSEYHVVTSKGQKKVIAESIIDVCKELSDEVIISIIKDHTVEQYEVPDKLVVSVDVESAAAFSCGCKVYPESPAVLEVGSTVVLSAIGTDGWKFNHWELNGEIVSEEQQAVVTVKPNTENDSNMLNYRAVFYPEFSINAD